MELVILDRDGVINRDSDEFVRSPTDWKPIAGSLEAISRLNQDGFRVVVATNQSGIARGLFDIDTLNAIHEKMHNELSRLGAHLDAVFFCPHGPTDGCTCRKPKPGMLTEIGTRFRMGLVGVPVIGDSLRDIHAARAVGAMPILVRTGKGEITWERERQHLGGVAVFRDLAQAVDWVLAQR
jgi:D-glycero-D-manno-heptose 1,7-bisphosphate phosphatase